MATYIKKKGLDIKRYNDIKRLRGLNYREFESEMIKIFDEIERLKKIERFFTGQSDETSEDVDRIIEQYCVGEV